MNPITQIFKLMFLSVSYVFELFVKNSDEVCV